YGVANGDNSEKMKSKNGKMEQSFLSFKANNPDWEPNNLEASTYLTTVLQRRDQTPQRGTRTYQGGRNNDRLHPFMYGGSVLLDPQHRDDGSTGLGGLGSSTAPGLGMSMYSSEIMDSRQHAGRDALGRGVFALLDA
ncbi:hypothetical protein HK096_001356, partial [Nowakowskiella sp. JEL0078]